MGATYTRQSTYSEGDVIQASDTNDEFDQLLAAFAASTGHTHDGTTGEGGPISTMAGHSLTFGAGTAGTDITLTFDGESNDGVIKWMEDEDYFEFSDDILVASTEKLQFRDTAIYINSSADGQLDLVADTEIQIAATTIDINGAADISGNLAVGGNLTVAGNATVTGTTTFNGGTLTLGDSASDNVVFGADVDSSIIPDDDDTYDLGSASQQWRNIFIDGTAEIDTLSIDGTTVTSTGIELNVLDGITSTTAELNILDGVTSTAAELNILDGVTSTAAELNILDGVTSTAAEINILDGDTSATSTTVADADRVVLNDNGTMVQVAVTDLAAYFDDEITAMPNLVTTAATTVGALNSGSITSGFGTIDTGSSTITTTGLITGGSLDIDDVVINGSTIGHTDDTDLITVADGIATVAGELSVTTLDIGGTNVTASATELNLLDGVSGLVQADFTKLAAVDATAAEINTLDGITAVVGELNALDLGSTAVGTAVASKAVVLDSNKDYTGIRNLTLTGDLTVGGDDLTMGTNTAGHLLIADGTNFNPTGVGDLSEISTVANDDVFLAVDTSGGGLKKITRSTIVSGLAVSGSGIANVVEDTTPQLGGSLDVNGEDIVSVSNGNITLTPNGSGVVRIDGSNGIDMQSGAISIKNSGAQSYVRFYCESSNAHYAQLQAPAHSAFSGNITLTLPATTDTLVGKTTTDTLTNKTFGDNVSFGDNNITNVGDIALDSISADGTDINVAVSDNSATAFTIKQGSDAYFVVDTGNSSESVSIGTGVSGTAITLGHSTSEVTVADNLTVTGDLTVSGTTTTVNSTTVNLNDHNIVLDSGNSTSAVVNGAGITLEGGSGDDATFTYNTTGPKFELKLGSNHEDLQVDGLIAASLDISGDVDVDGTLEADAITVNETPLAEFISDTVGAMVSSNTESGITVTYQDADNTIDFTVGTLNQDTTGNAATATALASAVNIHGVSFDGSANIDLSEVIQDTVGAMVSSNTESGITVAYQDGDGTLDFTVGTLNQDTTGTAALATQVTISANNTANETIFPVFVDGATGSQGLETDTGFTYNPSTGRLTAAQLSGTLQTAAQTNITSLGTLTALTVDDITINDSTISDGGDFTIDVGGNITIDADGGNILLKDGGTQFGQLASNNNAGYYFYSAISDGDMVFQGNDGGSTVTALTLDMSDAGAATFNNTIKVGNTVLTGASLSESGDFTIDVGGDIILDADGGDFFFKDGGTSIGLLKNNSSDFEMRSLVNDKDIKFSGEDGGSTIVALTLDMSAAGAATFNAGANFGGNVISNSQAHDGGAEILAANNNQSTKLKIQGKSSGGTEHNWFLEVARSADEFRIGDGSSTAMTIDSSLVISDADGKIRAIPQSGSAKTSGYTLATGDVGNFIEVGSSGAITIPNSTFSAGDAVSVFNNTSGDVTVTCSITTAYIAGTDEDKSSVTLATRGVCTILFISGTVCVISGNVS